MARLPRLVVPGRPHLIRHSTRDALPALGQDADALAYMKALRAASAESSVQLHGYSLLPSEVRLLCTPREATGLARMMQDVGRRYSAHLNAGAERRGSVWLGRFASTVVEDSRFLVCLRIVERLESPWDAGCVEALERPRSSAGHHLGWFVEPAITEHPVYWTLGNTPFAREAAYRGLLNQGLDTAVVAATLSAVSKGWALGSALFSKGVEESTGRRAKPLPRGRPRLR